MHRQNCCRHYTTLYLHRRNNRLCHIPQVLINVPVADKAKKEAVLSAPALQSAVAEQEEKLAGNGRVLVRPSGTEALIRVMVEAQTEPVARETAELLANVIKNHGS